MNRFKRFSKYFIYISLAFLLLALIKGNYLTKPEIDSYPLLLLAIFLGFMGFVYQGISWGETVKKAGHEIKTIDSITSSGLAIFGKYIPGKVWVIMGRAFYLNENSNISKKDLSYLSFTAQLVSLWMGLTLGAAGLFLNGLTLWGLPIAGLWVALTLVIFPDYFNRLASTILSKLLKKNINIPNLEFKQTLKTLPAYFINWAFWCGGFYVLALSLGFTDLNVAVGLAFALAGTLGLMAIIFPGGLGIREGIIVSYLTLLSLTSDQAASISIASRLWFLIGEALIFVFSLIASRLYGKNKSFSENKKHN